jgi:hypothetical protein
MVLFVQKVQEESYREKKLNRGGARLKIDWGG